MNPDELKAERAKILREIEEKTHELQSDLAAVDRLIARCGGMDAPPKKESIPIVGRRRSPGTNGKFENGKVNLSALVRQAIVASNGQPFSKNTIVEWISRNHPFVEPNHPTISAQLWHMQNKKKTLVTVQERNGNKPAIYQTTASFALEP